MKSSVFWAFSLLFPCVLVSTPQAVRALDADIIGGSAKLSPIAITDLFGSDATTRSTGADISNVVVSDLERSGAFRPLDTKTFPQKPQELQGQPRFPDWRAIKADELVTGNVQIIADGQLRVEFRLWDVFAAEQMTGLVYKTTPHNWRRIAHIIADAIYKRLTGEAGYFDTRIVYVSETGSANRRIKRLAIMDQDGANHRYLTDGSYDVETPRFSPSRQEIVYFSHFNNMPRVYLYNIETGRQEVLGNFPGVTYAPRFSPDGDRVIMGYAWEGNSEIYQMDLRTRAVRRFTYDPATDTSPCYSPDQSQIVFNSDRGGSQQLYVMDADGSNVHRISSGEGSYAMPVWSPRGNLIAFAKFTNDVSFIGVMHPDGSGEHMLTHDFLDEGPTWAPNGRVIMFFRQRPTRVDGSGGDVKLWSIDLDGSNERVIPTPLDASDPAWSPLAPLN